MILSSRVDILLSDKEDGDLFLTALFLLLLKEKRKIDICFVSITNVEVYIE